MALSDEKDVYKLDQMITQLDNYTVLKRLAHEVAMYIGKKQRDRYYFVLEKFTQKYEKLFN